MHKHLALASLLLAPSLAGCVGADTTADGEDPASESDALKVCAKGATVKGVDVSYYQGTIDWAKVKAHGIRFGIARVSDGTGFIDPKFGANWSGMKAHGIIRGTYQFFRPGTDPIAQADLMIKQIKAHGGLEKGDLPPVLDVEVQDGVSDATVRSRILKWAQHMEAAFGRKPMIYTAPGFWNGLGAGSEFAKYTLWVANWQTSCPSMPSSWGGWKFWQNADNGTIPGISGHVDTDVFNGSLADLQAFAGASSGGGGGGSTTMDPPASLGGTVAGEPAVGRNPDGRLEIFAVGPKGNMMTIFQTEANGKWSDWFSLGGNLEGHAAVANNEDGRLEVFIRNASGALVHAWQDAPNGKIGSFASLGGAWSADPAVAKNKDGRLEVFTVKSDGTVHHVAQTKANGGWGSWATLGTAGGGLLDVSAVRGEDGKLRAFARGKNGATFMSVQGSTWSAWKSIGGNATSAPTVVKAGSGQLAAFVRGTDGALWHAWENSAGGTWSSWISLGGKVHAPSAAVDLDGRMDVFARGDDNALWRIQQKAPGGNWGAWVKEGGAVAGGPEAGRNKDGRLEVFYRASDSTVHHVWETAPEKW